MGARDPRIDAYIADAPDFARPILTHLRDVVHATCPSVEETMKWSAPHFDYRGEMMCSMAAFKAHCAFGFWKGSLIFGDDAKVGEAAGHLGRITKLSDLPPKKTLATCIREAMRLNDEGVKAVRQKTRSRGDVAPPDYFMAALRKNRKALAAFESFPPSHRREYIEWIVEAKREETREKRVTTAIEWIAEGKSRHWQYQKK